MQITIKLGDKPEEIKKALASIPKKNNENSLAGFKGKLKGLFGDGLEYQKKIRNEWN